MDLLKRASLWPFYKLCDVYNTIKLYISYIIFVYDYFYIESRVMDIMNQAGNDTNLQAEAEAMFTREIRHKHLVFRGSINQSFQRDCKHLFINYIYPFRQYVYENKYIFPIGIILGFATGYWVVISLTDYRHSVMRSEQEGIEIMQILVEFHIAIFLTVCYIIEYTVMVITNKPITYYLDHRLIHYMCISKDMIHTKLPNLIAQDIFYGEATDGKKFMFSMLMGIFYSSVLLLLLHFAKRNLTRTKREIFGSLIISSTLAITGYMLLIFKSAMCWRY